MHNLTIMDRLKTVVTTQLIFLATDKGLVVCGSAIFLVILLSTGSGVLERSISVNLLTSLGILVAVSKYFYEKRKDKEREIIELVSFFRATVLAFHEKFADKIRKEFPNLRFVRVRLSQPTLEYVRSHHSALAEKQYSYIFNNNKEIEVSAINTLNAVEEFSLKVNLLEAADSEDLQILHDTFVEIIEDLAIPLLYQRETLHDESMYSNTVGLYEEWEPDFSRRPIEERVKEFKHKLGIR
jgi:hypothetical protein